jgi:LacI family transcriptional regulator
MGRATIDEVAKRAGVSKATVSHVINHTRFVSDETRSLVLQAIEALNYRPSQIARSLSVQQTSTIGLLITDVANPFYHRIIQGVEDVALANDYSVFLFNASYDSQRSIKYIRSMVQRRVDGIILMSSRMSMDIVQEATREKVPTIVLDWNGAELGGAGAVNFNFEMGIRQAVAHLINLGHRKFAHVAGDLNLWTARIRRDLFLNCLAEYGVDPNTVPVIEGNFTIEGGRRALRHLVNSSQRPTAVFTVNDLTAIGMVFEAGQLGLCVPRDFSVIGVDDIALASQITPTLTTISLPGFLIGELCMSLLLEMINDTGKKHSQDGHPLRIIETELIVRESTAAPPED